MKSLILLLFLGAVVLTLAENPFQEEAAQEYLDEEKGENIAERAEADSGTFPKRLCRRILYWCVTAPCPPIKTKFCKLVVNYCVPIKAG
ncbi:uncharacterized protein [Porites lutea]|uniref:uncharacterized protein n=1 Tax=Porites lutea TaxID=51062 RepID=UPI003CC58F27